MAWRTGRYQDPGGAIDVTTTGYGIYPMAVLHPLVDWLFPQSRVARVLHHVEVRYDASAYATPESDHPLSGTTFTTWRVTLRRLEQFSSPGVWSD